MYKVTISDKKTDAAVLWKYCRTYEDAKKFSSKVTDSRSYKSMIVKVGLS